VTKDLRKLAEAATPGPWREGTVEKWNVFCEQGADLSHERVLLRMNSHFKGYAADAAFIAAANPTAVLALLDRIAAFEKLERAARNWDMQMDWQASRAPGEIFGCEMELGNAIDALPTKESP
jgi:hypothetical protein